LKQKGKKHTGQKRQDSADRTAVTGENRQVRIIRTRDSSD
jgi:hypothetical protein